MTEGGWIKVYRSMLKWEWYDDPATKIVFLHLLLTARHEPGRWHGLEMPEGSVLTSYAKLAAETGLTYDTVRRAIGNLKTTGEITGQSTGQTTGKGTLYRLTNWTSYQDDAQGNPQAKPQEKPTRRPGEPTSNKNVRMRRRKEDTPKPPKGELPPSSPYQEMTPVWEPNPAEEPTDEEKAAFYERHRKG